jgi:Ferric reductase like transmembrane component
VSGPSAYWYLTRGTGVISLVLLTVSVALGVANVRRVRTERVPRFVLEAVHRNASLLAIAFLCVHIATAILDGFAPIRLIDVIVPFGSAYRPLWLGFGAVAFDLLIAVALTSVLRRRFGYRAWRATHWAAYASWPVALLHGLGTGTDTKTTWMLTLTGACVLAVVVAVVARATAGWPSHRGARTTAIAASALVPLGLLVWLPSGPLAAGWAQRAGTPPSLLRAASTPASATAPASAPVGGGSSGTTRATSFAARATGTVRQGQGGDGLAFVHISLTLAGQKLSVLRIRIDGRPIDGGGVRMTSSGVSLGTNADPNQFHGAVTGLEGTSIQATVRDRAGAGLALLAELQINPAGGTVAGTVTAQPVR